MSDKEEVSIILPVFNAVNTIECCIDSIINQTEKNWKLIILNDGSTDGTKNIIESYEKKHQKIFIWSFNKNLGLVNALNKGLQLAQGKFIARMDADDEMLPNRIKQQLEVFKNDASIDICGMSYILNKKNIKLNFSTHDEITKSLFFCNPIVHPTVMMKVSKKIKIKYQNSVCEDYDLWTRLAMQGAIFKNINKPGIIYNRSSNQKSIIEKNLMSNDAILVAKKYSDFTNFDSKNLLSEVNYTFDQVGHKSLIRVLEQITRKNIFNIESVDSYFFKRLTKRAVLSLNFKSIVSVLYFLLSKPRFILKLISR